MRGFFSLLRNWIVIATVISVIGGHWAVLQSVAWTTMVIASVHTENFTDALKDTFDGEHPCDLCKSIGTAHESEKKQDTQSETAKLNLFHQSVSVTLVPPGEYWRQAISVSFAPGIPRQPLLRPPRVSLVS